MSYRTWFNIIHPVELTRGYGLIKTNIKDITTDLWTKETRDIEIAGELKLY